MARIKIPGFFPDLHGKITYFPCTEVPKTYYVALNLPLNLIYFDRRFLSNCCQLHR